MGKEVGLGMRDKLGGRERSSRYVVLAFFSVVASSPNLSTFHFSPAKIRRKNENENENKNKKTAKQD